MAPVNRRWEQGRWPVTGDLPSAELGVFGGSGFYTFLDDVEEVKVPTPWGPTSAPVTIGSVEGRRTAFLPRHGAAHDLPPHRINFRANTWAMHELGVRRIFGPCAAGSLRRDLHPGHLVVCDQLVDRTCGRPDTYFDGPVTHHVPFADPYCSELRAAALAAGAGSDLTTVDGGTVVVVQGPRFSTRAESRWFGANGWDVVNMTQHPEAVLARELGICYAGLALVTDYDVGVEGDRPPVSQEEVFNYFGENVHRLLGLLRAALPMVAEVASCHCAGGAGPFSALPRS